LSYAAMNASRLAVTAGSVLTAFGSSALVGDLPPATKATVTATAARPSAKGKRLHVLFMVSPPKVRDVNGFFMFSAEVLEPRARHVRLHHPLAADLVVWMAWRQGGGATDTLHVVDVSRPLRFFPRQATAGVAEVPVVAKEEVPAAERAENM